MRVTIVYFLIVLLSSNISFADSPRANTTLELNQQGLSLGVNGEFDKAKETFQKILIEDRFDYTSTRCLDLIDQFQDQKISRDCLILIFQGLLSIYQFKYQDALNMFDKAKGCSKDEMILNDIGSVYVLLGNPNEAIKCFQKAISINPDSLEAYLRLSEVNMALENTDLAIKYAKKALSLDPGSARAYMCLGGAYFVLGKKNDALVYYKRALQNNPNFAEAYLGLGLAYADMGDVKQAIDNINKAKDIAGQRGDQGLVDMSDQFLNESSSDE